MDSEATSREPITAQSILKVSRYVSLESIDKEHVVLVHTAEQHRVKLKRTFYRLLKRLSGEQPLSEIIGGELPVHLITQLDRLRAKRFVILGNEDVWDRPRRLTAAVPYKMFGTPEFLSGAAGDVVVLGVPYDLTDPAPSGCRLSPDKIRQRSLDFRYEIDFKSGKPRGWFDVDAERRILENVRIADAGNIVVNYGEPQSETFARVSEMIRVIASAGAIPLVLGGDHSISVPVIACLSATKPLSVIALSAHTQFDPDVAEGIINAASANCKIWELPRVLEMILIGHRGYTRNPKATTLPPNVDVVTTQKFRTDHRVVALDKLDSASDVYLTIDANVLDPSVMPAARLLTPGGLTLDELKVVITEIGARCRIVGFDLVGFDGLCEHTILGELVACHVLLVAAAAATGTLRNPLPSAPLT